MFVVTLAAFAVVHEYIAWVTATLVAAGPVDASRHAAAVVDAALLLVNTRRLLAVGLVSLVTDALEAAHKVLALTVGADAALGAALIHVLAGVAVPGQLVALGTLAEEGAQGVDTLAAPAQARVTAALIYIYNTDTQGVDTMATPVVLVAIFFYTSIKEKLGKK